MSDTRDARQIAWDAIRELRAAAYSLSLDHHDPAAETMLETADKLADDLMTSRA